MFKIKKIENKTVYYSDIMPVEHFFTTRELEVGENIDLIKDYLNVDYLIRPQQVHGDNVEIIEDKLDYPSCDALILNQANKAIYLNFADCTPLVFYDPINNISAISHAGWRGTALKIGVKTILKMKEKFNSNLNDIIALIGPCISFSEFETSFEAIEMLGKTVNNKTGIFDGRKADLKGINKRQLEELGVKKIDVCPFCTVLDNDKFFSYRKENKTIKRHSAIIKCN